MSKISEPTLNLLLAHLSNGSEIESFPALNVGYNLVEYENGKFLKFDQKIELPSGEKTLRIGIAAPAHRETITKNCIWYRPMSFERFGPILGLQIPSQEERLAAKAAEEKLVAEGDERDARLFVLRQVLKTSVLIEDKCYFFSNDQLCTIGRDTSSFTYANENLGVNVAWQNTPAVWNHFKTAELEKQVADRLELLKEKRASGLSWTKFNAKKKASRKSE